MRKKNNKALSLALILICAMAIGTMACAENYYGDGGDTFYMDKSTFRTDEDYKAYCEDMYFYGYMDENYEWTNGAWQYIQNPHSAEAAKAAEEDCYEIRRQRKEAGLDIPTVSFQNEDGTITTVEDLGQADWTTTRPEDLTESQSETTSPESQSGTESGPTTQPEGTPGAETEAQAETPQTETQGTTAPNEAETEVKETESETGSTGEVAGAVGFVSKLIIIIAIVAACLIVLKLYKSQY